MHDTSAAALQTGVYQWQLLQCAVIRVPFSSERNGGELP